MGRPLLPAAAMLDMACAATHSCLKDLAHLAAVLADVAIPSPLQLPLADSKLPALSLTLNTREACLSLVSEGIQGGRVTHLRCSISCLADGSNAGTSGEEEDEVGSGVLMNVLHGWISASQPLAYGTVIPRQEFQADAFAMDPAVIDNGTQVRRKLSPVTHDDHDVVMLCYFGAAVWMSKSAVLINTQVYLSSPSV